jgi:regulator of protease activity HflC (stomatin/prohibitin superfamily)
LAAYKTHPPSSEWPGLYTARHENAGDARRFLALVFYLGLVVFIAWPAIVFFMVPQLRVSIKEWQTGVAPSPTMAVIWAGIAFIAVFLIVSLVVLVIFIIVLRASAGFFDAFYKPPEGVNVTKILLARFFGVPGPFSFLLSYPFVLINIVDVTTGKFDLEHHPAHWLGGPATLVVFDGTGVYLQRGNQFSRTLGPGIHFLERYETIMDIVDLRRQTLRSGSPGMPPCIQGRTKDGIKIKFNVEITFHVVRAEPKKKKIEEQSGSQGKSSKKTRAEKKAEELYLIKTAVNSGDLGAIRKAVERTTVRYKRSGDSREYSEGKWRDGVWGSVSGELAKYITRHFLDELLIFDVAEEEKLLFGASTVNTFGAGSTDVSPRAGQLLSGQEREKLRRELDAILRNTTGVMLTDLRIVDFELPAEVNEQRLRVLEAEMKSRVRRIEGNAAAKQTLTNGEMHAQAQQELIGMVADGLKKIDPSNFADSVLLSLSNILSQSLDDPSTAAYTARDTLAVMDQLREFLNQKEN